MWSSQESPAQLASYTLFVHDAELTAMTTTPDWGVETQQLAPERRESFPVPRDGLVLVCGQGQRRQAGNRGGFNKPRAERSQSR